MSHQHLDLLAAKDPQLQATPEVELVGTRHDPGHAQRRCQQRGISLTKIRFAMPNGPYEIHHNDERWTLFSRQLRLTPYARYENELTGLQLIGRCVSPDDNSNAVVQLKTCKWSYRLRRR